MLIQPENLWCQSNGKEGTTAQEYLKLNVVWYLTTRFSWKNKILKFCWFWQADGAQCSTSARILEQGLFGFLLVIMILWQTNWLTYVVTESSDTAWPHGKTWLKLNSSTLLELENRAHAKVKLLYPYFPSALSTVYILFSPTDWVWVWQQQQR